MAKMRAFDGDNLLASRLDGIAAIAANIEDKANLTLDPTERHGFEYQNWFGFTLFAEGFVGAMGRGGSYEIPASDGETENAVGFSLYPSPLIDAGFSAKPRDILFLPLGHDIKTAASLRAEGWRTVAALSDSDDAATLGCTHHLDGKKPVAI
jgi:ATP phosphoribosyltransferase regulatory subunit